MSYRSASGPSWLGTGITRRVLLRTLGGAAVYCANCRPLVGQAGAGFRRTSTLLPVLNSSAAFPATPSPPGSTSVVYDIFHNHWALATPDPLGHRAVLVLPAQAQEAWIEDRLSKLDPHPWVSLAADEFGGIWIAAPHRMLRLDPHYPENGWLDLSATRVLDLAHDTVTALGVAPNGALLAAFASGKLATVDHDAITNVQCQPAPQAIDCIGTDEDGNVWARTRDAIYIQSAAPEAWQHKWQLVARLPGGDHDLSGDVMEGCFYMAGGQNGGWGYPARRHVFDQVFALEPGARAWRVAGRLTHPRFYNGTSYLDGKIWIVAGNRRDAEGNAIFLDTVEICDPADGTVTEGPRTPFPIEMPVALHIGGRIYVAGGVNPIFTANGTSHIYNAPCKLISIGPQDKTWRTEPDGPIGVGPASAAALDGNFYVTVPHRGLFCFDTAQRVWRYTAPPPAPPRSAQVAAFRGEIWVMGGRDIDDMRQTLIYSPATDRWRSGPSLPYGLAWGAGAVLGGHVMVAGGANMRCYSNATYLLRT